MKVPYALVAAMPVPQRNAQMQLAVNLARERGYPHLTEHPIDERKVLIIAGYAASLADTWTSIRDLHAEGVPILSMSGATRFLADKGIIADYHVDMDPRAHKIQHLIPPVPGVTYLMASVCPPETWNVLRDQRVVLWHTYSGKDPDTGKTTYDWVAEHDTGEMVIHGGSTIGLTALHIGGVLGYRHFEIHGMDGSYADASRTARHAGPHYGKPQQDGITWNAEGMTYHTSRIMANAVAETINTFRRFPMFGVFHGSGLTQALIREADLPNAATAEQTEKATLVRRRIPQFAEMPVVRDGKLMQGGLWDHLLAAVDPQVLTDLQEIWAAAETRRQLAKFNTGSIPLETGLQLRALCAQFQPNTIIEVGTFIGKSTFALRAREHLYTCDRDNDCLPSTDRIHTYPYTTSTAMLTELVAQGVKADLVFFDGRIQDADIPLLAQVCTADALFVFDDYHPGGKGLANIQKLQPHLPTYLPITPYERFVGRSTLAVMLPVKSQSEAAAVAA